MSAFLKAITAINKRADAILKEGEGAGGAAAPVASGPTASDVHVPTANMEAGPKKKPKKEKANG